MTRDPGLDAARALAIALVVATHAALSFMVTPIGWAIQDGSSNLGVDLGVWVVRAFAIPSFFWLSGYFARAVYERRGVAGFVRNRAARVLAPLALALVPCSLALDAMWDWGRELAMRPEVADDIPKLEGSKLPLTLGHLWYLYYLLVVSALAVALIWAGRRSRVRIPLWIVPVVVPLLVLVPLLRAGALQLDTPLGFRIDPWVTLYFGGFFGWGWVVHARPAELQRLERRVWWWVAVAGLLLAAILPALAHGKTPVYEIAASGAFSLALVGAFVGLCVRYVRRPVFEFASDASYWTYIVHLPLVVLLQIELANVSWPGPIKYLTIVGVTAAACLVSYAAIARARGYFAASRRSTDRPARARSEDTP